MKKVLVLGGGKVGKSVAELLLACGQGNYHVTLADRDPVHLKVAEENINRLKDAVRHRIEFSTRVVDARDAASVRANLIGQDYVICMLPFDLVKGLAATANELGVHYFDVTEDVEATDAVTAIEKSGKAKIALVPQCGLAPGYIAIAANSLAHKLSQVHDLTLRVGALSQYPTNSIKYNVTWSAAGVVNEYCEPCNAMLDGKLVKVPALEGLEHFSVAGVEYEAFYTSGGVGSLIDTLTGEGKTSDETKIAYKTVRYPGHRDLMKFLLQDLRLDREHATPTAAGHIFNRALAVDLLEHGLARTIEDVVLVFINCIGVNARDGLREQANFYRSIPATKLFGRIWPAIELTTAAGVCAMVDLHRKGTLRQTGLIRQEECSLEAFNATPFGLAYEAPHKLESTILGK
ncbi:MAG: saccharopine dehydrogenase NADP-binding domain-containing protein [Phycisphaerales bacterium]|nr:saccharopine dehydrogenase NADP-binding domain-containing protein [Phycisphaerales bacterium]